MRRRALVGLTSRARHDDEPAQRRARQTDIATGPKALGRLINVGKRIWLDTIERSHRQFTRAFSQLFAKIRETKFGC